MEDKTNPVVNLTSFAFFQFLLSMLWFLLSLYCYSIYLNKKNIYLNWLSYFFVAEHVDLTISLSAIFYLQFYMKSKIQIIALLLD